MSGDLNINYDNLMAYFEGAELPTITNTHQLDQDGQNTHIESREYEGESETSDTCVDSELFELLESPNWSSTADLHGDNHGKKRKLMKKAPDAPKRFKTAYICFVTEKMDEVKHNLSSLEECKVTDIMKVLALMWKNLSPSEKIHYQQQAEDDKNRYFAELSQYSGPLQVPNKRQKKAADAPKRSMSAFLIFSKTTRPKLCRENPHLKNTDISTMLSQLWHAMSVEDKQTYLEQELVEREKYHINMKAYKERLMQEVHMKHDESSSTGSSMHKSIDYDLHNDVHDSKYSTKSLPRHYGAQLATKTFHQHFANEYIGVPRSASLMDEDYPPLSHPIQRSDSNTYHQNPLFASCSSNFISTQGHRLDSLSSVFSQEMDVAPRPGIDIPMNPRYQYPYCLPHSCPPSVAPSPTVAMQPPRTHVPMSAYHVQVPILQHPIIFRHLNKNQSMPMNQDMEVVAQHPMDEMMQTTSTGCDSYAHSMQSYGEDSNENTVVSSSRQEEPLDTSVQYSLSCIQLLKASSGLFQRPTICESNSYGSYEPYETNTNNNNNNDMNYSD